MRIFLERSHSPACRQAGVWCKGFMYFVYILKSEKDCNLYIGKTNDLKRRLAEHNSGQTQSIKSRIPFILLEYQTCASEEEARSLEKEYKKGYKREEIKRKYNLK